MMKNNTTEEWGKLDSQNAVHNVWWNGLSLEEKQRQKSHYEKKCETNNTRKSPFPNMYDVRHIRISQLTHKHIRRIWVFRDQK